MRLYLVRHPPPIVATGTCYGNSDLPVRPQEDAVVVERLLPELPPAALLFSSPLARCAGLAERLAHARGGTPVIYDARLVEMDFGEWELRSWNDIPRAEIDAWCDDCLAYRPGGGETVLEVAQRVATFRSDLERRRVTEAIVICHGGTIRMLQASAYSESVTEMARHAFGMASIISYGSMQILDLP
jgi:alpha-ribazole phosphatase